MSKNIITVSSRKMMDVDVFLTKDEDILGYQLGPEILKETGVKESPFPKLSPEGTEKVVNIKVYGRIEYLLDTETKDTEILRYDVAEDSVKREIDDYLKELDKKGICVSYTAIAVVDIPACSNCVNKSLCP
jgi:hypothetical protein